jgi:multidrug transporter EmrE-like cation transporter
MAKYSVSIGDDFLIDAVEVEDIDAVERLAAIAERRAAKKRETSIAYAVLGFIGLAITVSAVVGLIDGSYNELAGVWATGSIWVGVILGRYFKKE